MCQSRFFQKAGRTKGWKKRFSEHSVSAVFCESSKLAMAVNSNLLEATLDNSLAATCRRKDDGDK